MTRPTRPRVVLITGASSGIGKACAQYLHAHGCRVYGTSRHAAMPSGPTDIDAVSMIPMDVTSDASVEAAIALIVQREGRLDVVVNNAGSGIAGAIEDTSIDEAHAQFDTNFFGTLRVCRAVLPLLRQQGHGHLVNISSIAGLISVPFQGLYSASKFAVEGLTEALRLEMRAHGVQVALIEPGDFRTGFTAQRKVVDQARKEGPYSRNFSVALGAMEISKGDDATPEAIAKLLLKIIDTRSPKLRHLVGPWQQTVAAGLLRRLLPQRWMEAIVAQAFHLKDVRRDS